MRWLRGVTMCGALAGAASCTLGTGKPTPAANFLVVAGDSTYWVNTDTAPPRVRRSPIFLARFDGRFHEVYLADDDRSYYDAVIVGHRVFRRDIVAGDSMVVFEDSSIASVAAAYAAAHPDERPLQPGEDEADDPGSVSTWETEIIDVLGPYLTVELHTDLDLPKGGEKHDTRRSVIDLRSGKPVTLEDLMPDSAVRRVLDEARRAMVTILDSIRHSKDPRARTAAGMLRDFAFDPTSFSLTTGERGPAVAFLLPGHGTRAGGYAIPLPPVDIPVAPWWDDIRGGLPDESTDRADVWKGDGYDIVARFDTADGEATISIRRGRGEIGGVGAGRAGRGTRSELALTRVPIPVARVIRLDGSAGDGSSAADRVTLRALTRAFDEAGHYDDPVRTTSDLPRAFRMVPLPVRLPAPHLSGGLKTW